MLPPESVGLEELLLLSDNVDWRGPSPYTPSGETNIDAYMLVTMALIEHVAYDGTTWLPDGMLKRLVADRGEIPGTQQIYEWYRAGGKAIPDVALMKHYREFRRRVIESTAETAEGPMPWTDEVQYSKFKIVKLVPHADFPNDPAKLQAEMVIFVGSSPDAKKKVYDLLDVLSDPGLRRFIESSGVDFLDCRTSLDLRKRARDALQSRSGPFLLNLFALDKLPGHEKFLP